MECPVKEQIQDLQLFLGGVRGVFCVRDTTVSVDATVDADIAMSLADGHLQSLL
jgi:hypothetical protein